MYGCVLCLLLKAVSVSDFIVIFFLIECVILILVVLFICLKALPQIRGALGTRQKAGRLVLASGHLICFVALTNCLQLVELFPVVIFIIVIVIWVCY